MFRIACDHAGLAHLGGVCFVPESVQVLQLSEASGRRLPRQAAAKPCIHRLFITPISWPEHCCNLASEQPPQFRVALRRWHGLEYFKGILRSEEHTSELQSPCNL